MRYCASGQALGYPIRAVAEFCGGDIQCTITGGCSPHIGSVSFAYWNDGKAELHTFQRPHHKDAVVGDRFALELAGTLRCTVAVSCGIHYENPTRDDLELVVQCGETVLQDLLGQLGDSSYPRG